MHEHFYDIVFFAGSPDIIDDSTKTTFYFSGSAFFNTSIDVLSDSICTASSEECSFSFKKTNKNATYMEQIIFMRMLCAEEHLT